MTNLERIYNGVQAWLTILLCLFLLLDLWLLVRMVLAYVKYRRAFAEVDGEWTRIGPNLIALLPGGLLLLIFGVILNADLRAPYGTASDTAMWIFAALFFTLALYMLSGLLGRVVISEKSVLVCTGLKTRELYRKNLERIVLANYSSTFFLPDEKPMTVRSTIYKDLVWGLKSTLEEVPFEEIKGVSKGRWDD